MKNLLRTEKRQIDLKNALLNVMEDLGELGVRDEAILACIAEGVMVVDKRGIIILLNIAAEKMLGWKSTEAVGEIWSKILKREDKSGRPISPKKGVVTQTLSNKDVSNSVNEAYYYVRKDGTRFPIQRFASPIISKGNIIGTVVVFRDVTKEKEIDRMKTEFVSLASHQLRTPLTSIKWNLEMIRDKSLGELNEKQQEHLEAVFQSTETMIRLVNSLLNIARIESGRLTVEPKVTDMAALFRSTVHNLKPLIDRAGLKLLDKIPADLPKIEIDPQLISNVYSNLITNCIKYTSPNGLVEISIRKEGDFLISSVKDSGREIPIEEQKHIFERFFRGSNVSMTSIGNTGLGLYLTKSIVDTSGGKIWFESTLGKGSTFFFSLPLSGSPAHKGEITLTG